MTLLGREPAFWIGLIVTLILGALQTIAGVGLISDATEGQVTSAVNAVAQLLTLLAPLIAGLVIRQNVYAPDTTQAIADRAAATGNTDIGDPPSGADGDEGADLYDDPTLNTRGPHD